jgi:hypothetical protein
MDDNNNVDNDDDDDDDDTAGDDVANGEGEVATHLTPVTTWAP